MLAGNSTSFADQLVSSRTGVPDRKTLLAMAADNFYVEQQGRFISNGLSTDLICFPTDAIPTHRRQLNRKIDDAINYATAFYDVAALNALRALPPKDPGSRLPLGLYLYFADETSRLQPNTTFLTALRRAEAELRLEEPDQFKQKPISVGANSAVASAKTSLPDRDYQRAVLYSRMKKALESLGMWKSHGSVLRQWYQHGTYTIQGELHHWDDAGKLRGNYALLAEETQKDQRYICMNRPISYALAVKEKVQNLSPDKAYQFTGAMANPDNRQELLRRIAQGCAIRERRIRKIIEKTLPPHMPNKDEKQKAMTVLSQLPNHALELLIREGYSCAYTDSPTIRSCYPEENFPGNIAAEHESFRNGKGLHTGRYNIIYLSSGRERGHVDTSQEALQRRMRVAQTLLHEVMHIALSKLSDQEVEPLKQAVIHVHDELMAHKKSGDEQVPEGTVSIMHDALPSYMHEKLVTIPIRSLEQMVDFMNPIRSGYIYKNMYGDQCDTRWAEVACDTFGLLHSEYANSPFNPFAKGQDQLHSLQELQYQINRVMELALNKSRQEQPKLNAHCVC